MLKKITRIVIVFVIAIMGLSLFQSSLVFAVANGESAVNSNAGQLRSCQSRERNIKAIMIRMADRADKRLRLFDTVSEKVQGFYRQNGVIIDDYDAALAQVQAKRQVAVVATNRIKAQSTNFSCDNTDPKSVAAAYQDEIRNSTAAYKEYKDSIKELIASVKTAVQGDD